jgi:hypothetical protein
MGINTALTVKQSDGMHLKWQVQSYCKIHHVPDSSCKTKKKLELQPLQHIIQKRWKDLCSETQGNILVQKYHSYHRVSTFKIICVSVAVSLGMHLGVQRGYHKKMEYSKRQMLWCVAS